VVENYADLAQQAISDVIGNYLLNQSISEKPYVTYNSVYGLWLIYQEYQTVFSPRYESNWSSNRDDTMSNQGNFYSANLEDYATNIYPGGVYENNFDISILINASIIVYINYVFALNWWEEMKFCFDR